MDSLNSLNIDFNHPLAVKIRKQITKALVDFDMIQDGDKIMVCVSGGKDSSILLALLTEIQRRSERKFKIEAAILDQKQPGFQIEAFKNWVHSLNVPFHVIERDTYSIVTEKVQDGKTFCSLCSRLRRAILYDFAFDNGFSKMALGHHRDDLTTTTMLNLFYGGKTASMPPKLLSDDKRNILLRPMCYVAEKDLIELARIWAFPIIPCNLCGSQDGLKRQKIKKMLNDLEKEIPDIAASIQTALSNVNLSHMMDQTHFNFKGLEQVRIDAIKSGQIYRNPHESLEF